MIAIALNEDETRALLTNEDGSSDYNELIRLLDMKGAF